MKRQTKGKLIFTSLFLAVIAVCLLVIKFSSVRHNVFWSYGLIACCIYGIYQTVTSPTDSGAPE